MSAQSSERLAAHDGRQYHIGAAPGDVASHILLVGDPDRAERTAARFSQIRFTAARRDYRIYTGEHQGLELTVMCVGMGAGCMEIAVVELCQIVERPTFIRAGSSGALQPDIELGDLVISQGALRMENASLGYVDAGYPAFAHAEAQIALVQAAEESGARYHLGVTATAPGFYGAQGRNVPGLAPRDPQVVARLAQQGVKNLEMETSCLLTLAALHRARAGAVCAVYATRYEGAFIDEAAKARAEEAVITVGLGGLHRLARMREETGERPHWYPGVGERTAR